MKNFLLIILIATGLIACKNKPDSSEQRNIQLLPDATSYSNNVLSDTNSMVKAEVVPQKIGEKSNTKTIVRTIVIERPAAPNGNTRVATKRENDATPVTIAEPAPTSQENNPVSGKDNSASTETSGTATSSNGEKVQKKTGMNKAAQGAIIGGVTGAVAGAVISKKKGLGAVVGGIAGAAGGYIIGKKMDKKDNKFMIE